MGVITIQELKEIFWNDINKLLELVQHMDSTLNLHCSISIATLLHVVLTRNFNKSSSTASYHCNLGFPRPRFP